MKSIVSVNITIPTLQDTLSYNSQGSLRDYDIIVFDPNMPYYSRVDFSDGGSCISIEGTSIFTKQSTHWSQELLGALAAGKTVFIVLSASKIDQGATGSTMTSKTSRTYHTCQTNNYSAIPVNLQVKNARGRSVIVKDAAFRGLFEAVKEVMEYHVVLETSMPMRTIFAAKDGTPIGGVVKLKERSGHLVLLPFFDFENERFTEVSSEDEGNWNAKAVKASHAFVSQLVAIDRALKGSTELTPPPDWLSSLEKPKPIVVIESDITEIDKRIEELRRDRENKLLQKKDILEYSHLLYETGKSLERAIEKVLKLLGYTVETLRIGDLEIDHVIVSPTGKRMIGESEGKDTSAIDITKFRQLESNIGEDFERDEVEQPAKGLLFGNGFRLSDPAQRAEHFTQKCVTNAGRLGSALIRTADLYHVAVYLLNNPEDEAFTVACRAAIEETVGGVVIFPRPVNEARL